MVEAGVAGFTGGTALFGLTVALFGAVVHGGEGAFVVIALDVFSGTEHTDEAVAGALETELGAGGRPRGSSIAASSRHVCVLYLCSWCLRYWLCLCFFVRKLSEQVVQGVFDGLLFLLRSILLRCQPSPPEDVLWPRCVVLPASPQLVEGPREKSWAHFSERLSYNSYARLSPTWMLDYPVALVELKPTLEELGLIGDVWYLRLRGLKRGICGGQAIIPKLCRMRQQMMLEPIVVTSIGSKQGAGCGFGASAPLQNQQ